MMSNSDTIEIIKEKMQNDEAGLRREAANDLVFIDEPETEEMLLELLLDENKGVREAAGDALLRRGNQSGAQKLVEYFANPRIEVRNQAMLLLTEMGEPVLEYVIPALSDSDHDVRKFAADVLGGISSPAAVRSLVETIDDEDPNVAFSVVEALGKIGGDEALEELAAAFRKFPKIRAMVAETLGKLGNPDATGVIRDGLGDEDPLVVFAVVEAYGLIGAVSDLETLENLIEKSEGYIKSIVMASLVKIINRTNGKIKIDLLSDAHIENFNDAARSDREVAEFAEGYVVSLATQENNGRLTKSYPKLNDDLKALVLGALVDSQNEDALNILYKALTDQNPKVKMAAIKTLSFRKDNNSLSNLIELLDDEDDWVSYRATEAVGMIGSKENAELLLPKIETKNPLRQIAIIKALDSLGAIDELHGLLSSNLLTDEGVRETLSEIIGSGK